MKKKKRPKRSVKTCNGQHADEALRRNQDLFREEQHRAREVRYIRRSEIQECDPGFDDIIRAYENNP